MKTILPCTSVLSLVLLSFALPGDQLRFAVKEKAKLNKVFDDKTELHSTSFSMTIDGDEAPEMDFKLSYDEKTHVEVTDEYGALKDGKPSKVTRVYNKLGGSTLQKIEPPEGMEGHGDVDELKERSSKLEGLTVVFKLNDDGDGYKADFPDGKGDADLLKRLDEDMDLRGFLPKGEVTEDKSWEIEPEVFNAVLGTPGGDLKIRAEDDEEDDSDIAQQFEDNVKGKCKGTYKGRREVDGHKCAVIELEGEIKTHAKDDKSLGDEDEGIKTIALEYTLEGELLWDIEEGHFHKCTLSSKVKMTMKDEVTIETDDGKLEMVRVAEFEGESEFTAAIED